MINCGDFEMYICDPTEFDFFHLQKPQDKVCFKQQDLNIIPLICIRYIPDFSPYEAMCHLLYPL